jgi:Xaa-Pro aminopeptidase
MSNATVEGLDSNRDVYSLSLTPLERVTRWLVDSSLDELVLTGPEWVRWITGYSSYGGGLSAVVIRSGNSPVVILSGLEKEAALEGPDAHHFIHDVYSDVGFGLLADPVPAIANAYFARASATSANVAHIASEWLGTDDRFSGRLVDASEPIGSIRMVKSVREVEEIARRVQLCWVAERAIARAVERGASEIELFSLARSAMEESWGSPIEMVADVIGGPSCAGIGAPVNVPGRRVVDVGESLIADIAIVASGYCADITWTHIRGASAELEDLRDRLIDVRSTIVRGLVPGRPCSDVYREMSELVRAAAPEHTFTHHGGHGIGLAFYEAPFLTPWCDTELREGMTLAVEPGAYGRGHGVRVENNYLVTAAGGVEIPGRPSDMGRRSDD